MPWNVLDGCLPRERHRVDNTVLQYPDIFAGWKSPPSSVLFHIASLSVCSQTLMSSEPLDNYNSFLWPESRMTTTFTPLSTGPTCFWRWKVIRQTTQAPRVSLENVWATLLKYRHLEMGWLELHYPSRTFVHLNFCVYHFSLELELHVRKQTQILG